MSEPKPTNRRGTKSCLTQDRKDSICAVVAMGCTLKAAADFVGVARRTVYSRTDRDPEFAAALLAARSRGQILNLGIIKKAAEDRDWRAAAWILTHCHQKAFALRRSEGITSEQLGVLFGRFTEMLLGEVRDRDERERIATRLDRMSRELSGTVEITKQLEHDA